MFIKEKITKIKAKIKVNLGFGEIVFHKKF